MTSLLQGLTGCHRGVGQGCGLLGKLSWGRICFQDDSGCWQNSRPCGCGTQIQFLAGFLSEATIGLFAVLCHLGLPTGQLASAEAAREGESLQLDRRRSLRLIIMDTVSAKSYHLCHSLSVQSQVPKGRKL